MIQFNSFVLEYTSPTSIETAVVQAPTGFLREVLVIIKAQVSDVSISTITAKPSVSVSELVDGLFDGGMNKVSYIRLIDADISSFSVKNSYFTILLDGFSDVEILAKELGDFEGVIGFETDSQSAGIENKTCKMYAPLKNGYTIGYSFGLGLSSPIWINLQYKSSNKNVEFIDNLGIANTLYNTKISTWGKDDVVGLRLISFFVGGEAFSKAYIEKEIAINLQTNNINYLASELSYNLQDASLVEANNSNYIQRFYVDTGLIETFEYEVKLSTNNEFLSNLYITPIIAIWKINMIIKGAL
jgi:hypothetical protein